MQIKIIIKVQCMESEISFSVVTYYIYTYYNKIIQQHLCRCFKTLPTMLYKYLHRSWRIYKTPNYITNSVQYISCYKRYIPFSTRTERRYYFEVHMRITRRKTVRKTDICNLKRTSEEMNPTSGNDITKLLHKVCKFFSELLISVHSIHLHY